MTSDLRNQGQLNLVSMSCRYLEHIYDQVIALEGAQLHVHCCSLADSEVGGCWRYRPPAKHTGDWCQLLTMPCKSQMTKAQLRYTHCCASHTEVGWIHGCKAGCCQIIAAVL